MTDHKIHDDLPSGFGYATPSQKAAFDATGSVNGASKVVLVMNDEDSIDTEIEILLGISNSAPAIVAQAIINTARLAIRLRPPRTWDDIISPCVRRNHNAVRDPNGLAWYIREYNNGYAAGKRGGGLELSPDTSAAWDDGFLDGVAGRLKWHLTYCTDHDNCGEA